MGLELSSVAIWLGAAILTVIFQPNTWLTLANIAKDVRHPAAAACGVNFLVYGATWMPLPCCRGS